LERLRFTTSNPHDFSDPLAQLFAENQKLGKYIHLPVQSGSNRILSEMKRKVTVEEYMQRINALRNAIPDMAISTDLIVGFPGETEADFLETLDLVKRVRFSFIFAFKYSSRKGTAASRFKDQIDDQIASERLSRLNEIQNKITFEENQKEISKCREVLFLYQSKKEEGIWYGRTPHFRLVRVPSTIDLTGKTANVQIIEANKTALSGEIVS
jgi:tRNA-2-methylthio-N6-dimethylallyladenosine synthase